MAHIPYTVTVDSGSGVTVDDTVSTTSTNPVENQAITNYVDAQIAAIPPGGGDSDGAMGQLLRLTSAGTIAQDYGSGVTTATGYGDALAAALSDVQANQTIVMRGFTAAKNDLTLTAAKTGVTIIADNVTITRGSTAYSHLFNVLADNTTIIGLKVDGLGTANTGNGYGFSIAANHCKLYNITANNTRGFIVSGTINNGSALRCSAASDLYINGFYSNNAGYSSMRFANCNRAFVVNCRIDNPFNRAINIEGDGLLESLTFQNIVAIDNTPNGEEAGVFVNVNNQAGRIKTLTFSNCQFTITDRWGAGYSYNHAQQLALMKFQNVSTLRMDRVRLWHGMNLTPGVAAPSLRHEGTNASPCREIHLTDCVFAGPMAFSTIYEMESIVMKRCQFGARQDLVNPNNAWDLILDIRSHSLVAEECIFNLGSSCLNCFDIQEPFPRTMKIRCVNNKFLANRALGTSTTFASRPRVFRDNTFFLVGQIVNADNTYVNIGTGGDFTMSNDDVDELPATTDISGTILFDSTKVIATGGTFGHHPIPWTGYTSTASVDPSPTSYFPELPPAAVLGAQIRNVRYRPNATASTIDAIRGWQSVPDPEVDVTVATTGLFTQSPITVANGDTVFFTYPIDNAIFRIGTVNTGTDTLTTGFDVVPPVAQAHRYTNGQMVTFVAAAGATLPAPLVQYGQYFVRDVTGPTATTLKVSTTLGGIAENITNTGVGAYYIMRWPPRFAVTAVNSGTNVITVPGHNFINGQAVSFERGDLDGMIMPGATSQPQMLERRPYFVREAVAGTSFKLEATFGAASAISFNSSGFLPFYVRRWTMPICDRSDPNDANGIGQVYETQRYYVRDVSGTTFRITPATPTGTALAIQDVGAGSFKMTRVRWVKVT